MGVIRFLAASTLLGAAALFAAFGNANPQAVTDEEAKRDSHHRHHVRRGNVVVGIGR